MKKKQLIQENIELAQFTTFKIGGKARLFTEATTESEIIDAIYFADENELDVFILGGGSNVLISDKGFDGLVIKIASKGISVKKDESDSVLVTAQAGEDWDDFVNYCVENNFAGLECLSGIPGLVGGTPIQNVGAYGQEVSETIEKVRVFDRKTKQILELTNSDCGFTYRKSIFNTIEKGRFIVLAVTYLLEVNGKPKIVYKDLLKAFDEDTPTLSETRKAVCKIRKSKAMLVRQGGTDAQSAGSFFKNPIITKEDFEELINKLTNLDLINNEEVVPYFEVDENNLKVPAAWLIERVGFNKGYKKDKAGLSTKHTLALTNRGDAQAADIITLKDEIQKQMKSKLNIDLVPEPNFIGFD